MLSSVDVNGQYYNVLCTSGFVRSSSSKAEGAMKLFSESVISLIIVCILSLGTRNEEHRRKTFVSATRA